MDYNDVKLVHMSAVAISFAGFFARGVGMLGDAAWIRHRLAKTLPHVVDTVLIVSAIWLAWTLRQGRRGRKIERTALPTTAERARRNGGNGQSRYNRAHPENDSHDCP